MNLLVIDIGTSSMRGILCDEKGKKLFISQIKYKPEYNLGGGVSQKPEDWVNALVKIVKEITLRAKAELLEVNAVTVTSQRSSIIPVDKHGIPLMDAIMWQDSRNAKICEGLKEYEELLLQKTGALPNTVFSGSKMAWIKRNNKNVFNKTYKFLNIPEFLFYFMTNKFRSDVTYASRTGLMNLRERKWDSDVLKIYDIEESYLCELVEPGEIVGYVCDSFATLTGIKNGTPVITSGGDQQCASIGQGSYKEGNLSIVTGTGAFLTMAINDLPDILSREVIINCSALKGKYMVEANVLTCCSAFDWFGRNFYGGSEENIDYKKMNDELKAAENVSSVVALPYFSGRSTPEWNPDARATFAGITLSTKRGDILKGLVEGICMEINNNINSMRKYADLTTGYLSGGLSVSDVINQIQADVYGFPVKRRSDFETTAQGAFLVAACGMGIYTDMETAFAKMTEHEDAEFFYPNTYRHSLYTEKQRYMNLLYQKIEENKM